MSTSTPRRFFDWRTRGRLGRRVGILRRNRERRRQLAVLRVQRQLLPCRHPRLRFQRLREPGNARYQPDCYWNTNFFDTNGYDGLLKGETTERRGVPEVSFNDTDQQVGFDIG